MKKKELRARISELELELKLAKMAAYCPKCKNNSLRLSGGVPVMENMYGNYFTMCECGHYGFASVMFAIEREYNQP
jgi:hypothetical protein